MIIRIAASILLGLAASANAGEHDSLRARQGLVGDVVEGALGQVAGSSTTQSTPARTSSISSPRVVVLTAAPLPSITDTDLAPPSTTPTTTTTTPTTTTITTTPTTTATTTRAAGGGGILPPFSLPDLGSLLECPLTAKSILTCLDIFGSTKTLTPTTSTTQDITTTTSAPINPGFPAPVESTTRTTTTKVPDLPDCDSLPDILANPVACLTNGLSTILNPTPRTTTTQPAPNPGPAPPNPGSTTTTTSPLSRCPLLNPFPIPITCLNGGETTTLPPLLGPPGTTTTTTAQQTSPPPNPGNGNPTDNFPRPTTTTTAAPSDLPDCPFLNLPPLFLSTTLTCQNNGVPTTITPLLPGPSAPTTSNTFVPPAASTTPGPGPVPAQPPSSQPAPTSGLPQCPDSLLGNLGNLGNPAQVLTCPVGTVTSVIDGGATSVVGGGTSAIGGSTSAIGSIIPSPTPTPDNTTSTTLAPWVPVVISDSVTGTLAIPAAQTGEVQPGNSTSASSNVVSATTDSAAATSQSGIPSPGLASSSNTAVSAEAGTISTFSSSAIAAARVESTSSPTPATLPSSASDSTTIPITSSDSTATSTAAPTADQEAAMMSIAEYICCIFGCGGSPVSGQNATISLTTTAPGGVSTTTLSSIITTTADPPPAQTKTVTKTEQAVVTQPVDPGGAPLSGWYGAASHLTPTLLLPCLTALGAALFATFSCTGLFP